MLMRTFTQGVVVSARGRSWIVVCPPEGEVDLLVADPLPRDDERRTSAVFDKIVAVGKNAPPPQMAAQRTVLDLTEIE
jgi:hypothetical protein